MNNYNQGGDPTGGIQRQVSYDANRGVEMPDQLRLLEAAMMHAGQRQPQMIPSSLSGPQVGKMGVGDMKSARRAAIMMHMRGGR